MLVYLLFVSHAFSQKSSYCEIIQFVTKSEIFQKRFHICNYSSEVYIIDTLNHFRACDFIQACGKKVIISDTIIVPNRDVIQLYKVDHFGNKYNLYFHRLLTGATLIMKVKKKRKTVTLLSYREGAF
jgi:hypothetical protein